MKWNSNERQNNNSSNSNEGIEGGWGGMNPAVKRHLELQIKTLQNAPRDADKLERLLKSKRRQKEEAMEREVTETLVTEIETLKVVLYLVSRNESKKGKQ
jgi:type VI protein secretion system component VasF